MANASFQNIIHFSSTLLKFAPVNPSGPYCRSGAGFYMPSGSPWVTTTVPHSFDASVKIHISITGLDVTPWLFFPILFGSSWNNHGAYCSNLSSLGRCGRWIVQSVLLSFRMPVRIFLRMVSFGWKNRECYFPSIPGSVRNPERGPCLPLLP